MTTSLTSHLAALAVSAVTLAVALVGCASGAATPSGAEPPATAAQPVAPTVATPLATPEPSARAVSCHLTVLLVAGGIGIKSDAGNIAPGCADVGAGLTLPRPSPDRDDEAGLASCAAKLKELCHEDAITLFAPETTLHARVLEAIDVLKPIFPRLALEKTLSRAVP